MRAGELPLELIRMKAKGCQVELSGNEPGFTLPSNIGELGDDITKLDLRGCSLRGASRSTSSTRKLTMPRAGAVPASIGNLTNLRELNLWDNELQGECSCSFRHTRKSHKPDDAQAPSRDRSAT